MKNNPVQQNPNAKKSNIPRNRSLRDWDPLKAAMQIKGKVTTPSNMEKREVGPIKPNTIKNDQRDMIERKDRVNPSLGKKDPIIEEQERQITGEQNPSTGSPAFQDNYR